MEETSYSLNPETAKRFNLVAGAPPVFESHIYGKIDIRTVSPEKVELLIKAGCDYFTPVEAKAEKAKA